MGHVPQALDFYRLADEGLDGYELNASLSVLRHNRGTGSGRVCPVPATEDQVTCVFLAAHGDPGEVCRETTGDIPEDHIWRFIQGLDPCDHRENIKEDRPHVMVLSTGRCGTMSLFRMFENSNLEAYHSYWFMPAANSRWEMVCRLYANNHDDISVASEWASCRAAEWLGERPMIGLNHTDTIFAPVFAAVHPEAKFVYLRRDAEKVFNSFYIKDQWQDGYGHFRPISYDFDAGFRFSLPDITEEEGIRRHIEFTENFARSFGRVMGDRWIEISADRLFDQDREEIAKLLEFVGSDIDLDVAVEHFATKINEKAHRVA